MQARGRPGTALLGCSIPDLQGIGRSLFQWSTKEMLEQNHVSQINMYAHSAVLLLYVVKINHTLEYMI